MADRLGREGRAHAFSLATWRLHRATLPLLEHAAGRVLDAGSGRSPYKPLLRGRGLQVLSLDVEDRAGEIDWLGDLQEMPQVETASVGTVLCTQVLEHLPRPWAAIDEIARVLEPGGVLLLSVPHLSAIHEAPHDYWRYTRHGLEALLTSRGFEIRELRESGGLFCFLGHLLSHAWLGALGGAPLLGRAAWALNYLLLVRGLDWLDRLAGAPSLLPCDYVVRAERRSDG